MLIFGTPSFTPETLPMTDRFHVKGSAMFRDQGFQYSTVRIQSDASRKPKDAILLRRRKQRVFPAISPGLVLVIGVTVAGIAVMTIGLLG